MGLKMKTTEKLKRIKLIGEEIYISFITNYDSENKQFTAKESITIAQIFVDEFEKFETEFLKENTMIEVEE